MRNEAMTLLQSLSAADGDQLVELLGHPSIETDAGLRGYFGPSLYQRLRNLALRSYLMRQSRESNGDEKPRDHVVIVPGILGSELSSFSVDGNRERVWLNARAMTEGALMRLRLDSDGLRQADPGYEIRPTGVLKRVYGALMLTLARDFEVHAFAYDWRRSFRAIADDLQAYLSKNFMPGEAVHLVAHAAGGLVVRHLLQKHPDHWKTFEGKLLLLGSSNYGSLLGVQALAGHLDLTGWVDLLDAGHRKVDFLSVIRSFPSIYEMLPSPKLNPEWIELFEPATFGPGINEKLLTNARKFRNLLDREESFESFVSERTISIIGVGRPTFYNIDVNVLRECSARQSRKYSDEIDRIYGEPTDRGDGSVPLQLADMRNKGIPTRFLDARKHDMLASRPILQAMLGLLEAQHILDINEWLQELGLKENPEDLSMEDLGGQQTDLKKQRQSQRDKLREAASRSGVARASTRHYGSAISDDERDIENVLASNLSPGLTPLSPSAPSEQFGSPLRIQVEVRHGDIAELGEWAADDPPVDAIVIGNHLGEMPQGACKALDRKITAAYSQQDSLFTQLIQRNVIRSELANLFLLPDPRLEHKGVERTIVIAGQGMPGSFGQPELKILAREVCWVLSRLGKKHLAMVPLGAGRSSFTAYQVMDAWIRGAKNALTGWVSGEDVAISITFVEIDEEKVLDFDEAVRSIAKELEGRITIEYTPLTQEELIQLQEKAEEKIEKKKRERSNRFQARIRQVTGRAPPDNIPDQPTKPAAQPIRVNISCENSTYRFGALTGTAAIPEREIHLSTDLVSKVNDDLAASTTWQEQIEHGRFLASLLLPEDICEHLISDAPVVLSLDATTARIHWELLCPPLSGEEDAPHWSTPGKDREIDEERFLGLGRGLTRQLRTSYAPRPQAIPARQRRLRVLVVADPAADAPLPGAQEEGVAVVELFERINQLSNRDRRVEVQALIGPGEATQTNVLRELMNRSYDVLHFAGHCVYNAQTPTRSGWIFTGGQLVTASEIRRVDRVPSFIFSNACESGITPDRSGRRSDLLAPTFAEAFFARGVANFVCTAWPVNDLAARDFALTLYAKLLGLKYEEKRGLRIDPQSYQATDPQPMYRATCAARKLISSEAYGGNTWGAYQHYGNPDAHLFV